MSTPRETIEWHYVADELPDDETTVLLAHVSDETDQPVVGYRLAGGWMWSNPAGRDVPAFFEVFAWAHLPGNPPEKESQK